MSDNHIETRPWGTFEILAEPEGAKIKLITVQPKHRLSYQCHAHRQEIWVVISGAGKITLDDRVTPVAKGTISSIPPLAKHRIECTSKEPLVFVEVQTGSMLAESDITRYADDYQR